MNAASLDAARAAHRRLADRIRALYPDEDQESLADTIAGETELDLAIEKSVRYLIDILEKQSDGCAARIKELQERKKRFDHSIETVRNAVLAAMIEAGWTKLPVPVPDFTISVGTGTPKLIVTDESALPFDLLEVVSKPNRAAIKEALKAGREVAGAQLSNSSPHLIVSRR